MTIVTVSSTVKRNIGVMITSKEKQGLRKKLLDACFVKQQFLIDDFKERIKALTESEGLGNEEEFDDSDIASNSGKASEINAINDLLEFANKELSVLEHLRTTQDRDHDRVAPGAIVVTNHQTFFISASLEKFSVDGHVYIGISTSSPIYQLMTGEAKGHKFVFKGTDYKIKDVF